MHIQICESNKYTHTHTHQCITFIAQWLLNAMVIQRNGNATRRIKNRPKSTNRRNKRNRQRCIQKKQAAEQIWKKLATRKKWKSVKMFVKRICKYKYALNCKTAFHLLYQMQCVSRTCVCICIHNFDVQTDEWKEGQNRQKKIWNQHLVFGVERERDEDSSGNNNNNKYKNSSKLIFY